MKRYIAAILVPCLLLQFTGCYSWRIIDTPEPGSHIKIYTKHEGVIEVKDWRYEDGNIVCDMGEEKLEGYTAVKVYTEIDKKELNQIEEEYFDAANTLVLIGGTFLAGLLVLFIGVGIGMADAINVD